MSPKTKPPATGPERHNKAFEVGHNDFLVTTAQLPSHLWITPSDGLGLARRLTSGTWTLPKSMPPSSPSSPVNWSPDAKSLVFVKVATPYTGDSDQSSIQVIDAETAAVRALTGRNRNESQPVISPDGKLVSYWYPRDGNSKNVNEIQVAPFAGGEGRSVTTALDRNTMRAIRTADSKSLIVSANDGTASASGISPSKARPKSTIWARSFPPHPSGWMLRSPPTARSLSPPAPRRAPRKSISRKPPRRSPNGSPISTAPSKRSNSVRPKASNGPVPMASSKTVFSPTPRVSWQQRNIRHPQRLAQLRRQNSSQLRVGVHHQRRQSRTRHPIKRLTHLRHRMPHRLGRRQPLPHKRVHIRLCFHKHPATALRNHPVACRQVPIHAAYRIGMDLQSPCQLPHARKFMAGRQRTANDPQQQLSAQLSGDRRRNITRYPKLHGLPRIIPILTDPLPLPFVRLAPYA